MCQMDRKVMNRCKSLFIATERTRTVQIQKTRII